jgi:AcrR family transcriptional regulator
MPRTKANSAKPTGKRLATHVESDESKTSGGWRQRALDRSLVEAKARALNKGEGFIQSASKLLNKTGGLDFTVQDVVDNCDLSLRSFYQTFASKEDLLIAMFEEYVESAAAWQREQMAKVDDPIEQIRVFLDSLWIGKLKPEVTRALALYSLNLSATAPAELSVALAPQLEVLHEAVERGVETGQVRDDIGTRRIAEILLHTGIAAVHNTILRTGTESAADVCAVCIDGISSRG